ncbi:MAG: polysaccharide deacetylase family protein [Clostridiaceae bacterium]
MDKIFLAIILSSFLLTGCSNSTAANNKNAENIQAAQQESRESGNQDENPVSGNMDEASDKRDPKANIDLKLLPNESGKIMVLMYHNIGTVESEWVRTPANFIKDLNTLYEKDYRPISLSDYVTGHITTPQGFTPVVITFDDGNMNNFEYLENGLINKDSAVGILTDFHEKHRDFPLEATFFVTGGCPFNQKGLESKKLNFIIDSGMDIGNHTKSHPNFKNYTGDEIQAEIGAEAQSLQQIINRADYKINTLALPFGVRPADKTLTKYLVSGSFKGIPYENIAILNVGWNPGYSPYDKRFDQTSIPRVRASEMKVDNVGLYNYLDYFDRNPQEKFISDGVDEVITIPEGKKELLNTSAGKDVYTY